MVQRFLAIVLFLSVLLSSPFARSVSLEMGVSVDVVPVGSDFDGTDIVIFGSIEGAAIDALNRGEYDVVIKIVGAAEDVMIRRKERVAGIWINKLSKRYVNVPSFYSVLSRRPLERIADKPVLQKSGLGISNLGARPDSQGDLGFMLRAGEFSSALLRLRSEQGLFVENPDSLMQLSPSLFRATLFLPPNVPIGVHKVTAHLFRDGLDLSSTQSSFRIQKVGFERWIYDLAHQQSLLYGIMAVLIAIFTGWAANAIFRKS